MTELNGTWVTIKFASNLSCRANWIIVQVKLTSTCKIWRLSLKSFSILTCQLQASWRLNLDWGWVKLLETLCLLNLLIQLLPDHRILWYGAEFQSRNSFNLSRQMEGKEGKNLSSIINSINIPLYLNSWKLASATQSRCRGATRNASQLVSMSSSSKRDYLAEIVGRRDDYRKFKYFERIVEIVHCMAAVGWHCIES